MAPVAAGLCAVGFGLHRSEAVQQACRNGRVCRSRLGRQVHGACHWRGGVMRPCERSGIRQNSHGLSRKPGRRAETIGRVGPGGRNRIGLFVGLEKRVPEEARKRAKGVAGVRRGWDGVDMPPLCMGLARGHAEEFLRGRGCEIGSTGIQRDAGCGDFAEDLDGGSCMRGRCTCRPKPRPGQVDVAGSRMAPFPRLACRPAAT